MVLIVEEKWNFSGKPSYSSSIIQHYNVMADEQPSIEMSSTEGKTSEETHTSQTPALLEKSPPDDPYAKNTPLTWVFGDHPKVKIIAALLSEEHDLNITNIARLAGMSRSTVYDHIDDLIKHDIVEETRNIGGSSMYRIKKNSDVAGLVAEVEYELLNNFYEQTED